MERKFSDSTLDARLTVAPARPNGIVPTVDGANMDHSPLWRQCSMAFAMEINNRVPSGVDKVVADAEKIYNYMVKGETPMADPSSKPNSFKQGGSNGKQ